MGFIGGRFGQHVDAENARVGSAGRKERLAHLAATSWPRLLLRVALQLVALFLLASLLVWLSGR